MSSLRSSILPETVDTTQPPQLSTSMEDMISPLAHPSTLPAVPASALSTTPSISAQSIPDTSRRPPPLLITDSSAQDIFQRMTSKLLAHAGFEGANENALRVLTDVATDYITNIGKTLRCYVDDYGKQMTGEVKRIEKVLYDWLIGLLMWVGNTDAHSVRKRCRGTVWLGELHSRWRWTIWLSPWWCAPSFADFVPRPFICKSTRTR